MYRESRRTTRRNLILGAGGVTAGLAFAPLGRAARSRPAARAQDAAKGGTLTYAFILRPRSLDPNVWTGRSDND